MISWPASKSEVQAVEVFSTTSRWSTQLNLRWSLRISAPGSRCDSQRIWKPLQMPEDRQAALGRGDERVHDGREAGDRAAAQVVAVGEPAGQDDRVDAPEVGVAVPEGDRLGADGAHGTGGVAVVERAGEGDDPDLHWSGSLRVCARTLTTSSITGFDSSFSAASRGGGEVLVGHLAVDGEDEALALPHVGELLEAEPGKGPADGLTLGVEDLWLQHDVNDDVAHSGVS